ncbi:tetratricopeptide repeat protein [Leyella stercorea]|uniref:tetratricopeptide repeat protein n=1 Tax=Leyella stercorea TaxID=363265 RepID=UPI00242B99F8|nr:hypothetical protein [Leyella stercorea]
MNMRKIAIGLLAFALVAPSIASVSLKDKKEKKPKTEKKAKVDNKTKTNKASSSNSPRKVQTINDVEAAILGIEKIVSHTLVEVEPIVQQICESQQTKKSVCPRIYVGAANAFWLKSGVSDTTYALKYIDKAIELDPHYAPAYMLKGDIYKWADDTTVAVNYYKKAIEMAPNDFRTYRTYVLFVKAGLDKVTARAFAGDTEAQEEVRRRRARMENIYAMAKEANPTYPYNRNCARLYADYGLTTNEYKKGIQLYEEVQKDSLEARDYINQVQMVSAFLEKADGKTKLQHYTRIMNICDSGLVRYPTDYYILANGAKYANMGYELVKKQQGEALYESKKLFSSRALEYSETLIASKDTLITDQNYLDYGKALINNNKLNQGIDVLKELLKSPTIKDDQVASAMGVISNTYKDMGEYDKAETAYQEYINTVESNGKLNYFHLQNYAKMYEDKAEECVGMEQVAAYKKAFDIYGQAAERFPDYADYGYVNQLQLSPLIDPDQEAGVGLQPALQLFNSVSANASWQLMATRYLVGYYYNVKKSKELARKYFMRWHELDPDNETVKRNIAILYKVKL